MRFCDHVHLKAKDVEATAQWYVEKLGGEVTTRLTFRGSPVIYVLVGGMTFIIYGKLDTDKEIIEENILPRYGVDHFGFLVNDIEAFIKDIRTKGVNVLEGPTFVREGVYIAYIEAPEKVRIEIAQKD